RIYGGVRAVILFSIDKHGTLLERRVEKSSGNISFDAHALYAIERTRFEPLESLSNGSRKYTYVVEMKADGPADDDRSIRYIESKTGSRKTIMTFGECSTTSPTEKSTQSSGQSPSKDKMPDCLIKLRNAGRFDGLATGFAGMKSANYLAYEQTIAQGKKVLPQVRYLVAHSSPAGRLYAALVLYKSDPNLGRAMLLELSKETVMVDYDYAGCVHEEKTVGEVAKELLSEKDVLANFGINAE
ncbi:MAG: energy transducer TonB, partial [Cyanobacteria bacterium]|nr:energy transducer TonB [Cyanobacteriota bacterium]